MGKAGRAEVLMGVVHGCFYVRQAPVVAFVTSGAGFLQHRSVVSGLYQAFLRGPGTELLSLLWRERRHLDGYVQVATLLTGSDPLAA